MHGETSDEKRIAGEGPGVPDYPLADQLNLSPTQLKLVLDHTRLEIIDLLTERAATTSQLAVAMERPKGTVGYHCKALEAAGLIHVVRTARVRAMQERYYGRTARPFILGSFDEAGVDPGDFLDASFTELKAASRSAGHSAAHLGTARYARIPEERAEEWAARLGALADEFAAQERSGSTTYGILLGCFVTERKGWS